MQIQLNIGNFHRFSKNSIEDQRKLTSLIYQIPKGSLGMSIFKRRNTEQTKNYIPEESEILKLKFQDGGSLGTYIPGAELDLSKQFVEYTGAPSNFERKSLNLSPNLLEVPEHISVSPLITDTPIQESTELSFEEQLEELKPNNESTKQQNLDGPTQATPIASNVGKNHYSNLSTNLDGWNMLATMNYLRSHKFAKHSCASSVEDALKIGGLKRFNCSLNGGNGWAPSLHYVGTLQKNGWQLVYQGIADGYKDHMNFKLLPGDICILGNSLGDKKNAHAAIYDGKQWLSDYKQDHMMAYNSHGKVKYFIYRRTALSLPLDLLRNTIRITSSKLGGIIKMLNGGSLELYIPGSIDLSKLFVDYTGSKPDFLKKKENTDSNSTLSNIFNSFLLKNTPLSISTVISKPSENTGITLKEQVLLMGALPVVEPVRTATQSLLEEVAEAPIETSAETPKKGRDIGKTSRRKGAYEKSEAGKRQFVHDLNVTFEKLGVKNEELRKVLVAQAALESGYGAASLGGGDYNYGNLTTGKNWLGDYRIAYDHDAKGNLVEHAFRSYSSMEDYAKDKLKFIGLNSHYKVDINKDDPMTYIDKIVKGHYAEDPGYRQSLTSMYKNFINKRWN